MKIYDKKLSSLHDLRRERQKLKSRLNGHDGADSHTDAPKEHENFLSGLLSGITSGSALSTALNIAPTIIDFIKKRPLSKKTAVVSAIPKKSTGKNIIAGALTDFVTGYIKWKVLELSYKGLRKLLKSDQFKSFKDKTVAGMQKPFKK